jgi:hypothetical protein
MSLLFPPEKPHAYTWLLMKGDSYLPGVFVSAWSVRRTCPKADLVVLCTPDVSQTARDKLLLVVDNIYSINYLTFPSKELKTARQRELYAEWVSCAYTKWQILSLPYEKVCQLDADTVVVCNIDELFDMQAPAMPLASPFTTPLGTAPNYFTGEVGLDGYPVEGACITREMINRMLKSAGTVCISTPAVIEPNAEDYADYIAYINKRLPYGSTNCMSAFDEQSICDFYVNSKKTSITAIHHRYNYYPWKEGFLFPGEIPRIIHFFSDTKPWSVCYDEYPDMISWYKMAYAACKDIGIEPTEININCADCTSADCSGDTFIDKFVEGFNILTLAHL